MRDVPPLAPKPQRPLRPLVQTSLEGSAVYESSARAAHRPSFVRPSPGRHLRTASPKGCSTMVPQRDRVPPEPGSRPRAEPLFGCTWFSQLVRIVFLRSRHGDPIQNHALMFHKRQVYLEPLVPIRPDGTRLMCHGARGSMRVHRGGPQPGPGLSSAGPGPAMARQPAPPPAPPDSWI